MELEICEDAGEIERIDKSNNIKNKWNFNWLTQVVEVDGEMCKVGESIKKGKLILSFVILLLLYKISSLVLITAIDSSAAIALCLYSCSSCGDGSRQTHDTQKGIISEYNEDLFLT